MDLLLKNANVIFVETSAITRCDILINNNRIKEISENIEVENIESIDCTDKWIIPGLIDMHVHIKESFAPLFTAAGITTVRNTSGSIIELEDMMNADISSETPRIITSDRLIDGPPGLWGPTSPYSVNIDNVETARDEVRRQKDLGAELIKVYGLIDEVVLDAVCKEAKKEKLSVSVDLVSSPELNALDAAKLGVKWLEHASGILQMVHPQWSMKADEDIWNQINWNEFDNGKIEAICNELLKYEVRLCPTMTLYDQGYLDDNPWRPDDAIIDKLEENKGLTNQWKYIMQSGHMKKKIGIQNQFIREVSKTYHDIGGIVVCGTDTPAGVNVFPGMALHREFELFVESGFNEFETLRSATIISADAMDRQDIGRIKEGVIADILILNSNPIDDISSTRDINYVIKGGKLYSPEELINAVPSDEQNQLALNQLIDKFKDNGFSIERFL